jgi:hypothetical protein
MRCLRKLPIRTTTNAQIRDVLTSMVATSESLEVHETMLAPGGAPHLWAAALILDAKGNSGARSVEGQNGFERTDARCRVVCRIPENQPLIENCRPEAFLESVESKIAEKEALDVGNAVVKSLDQRFGR